MSKVGRIGAVVSVLGVLVVAGVGVAHGGRSSEPSGAGASLVLVGAFDSGKSVDVGKSGPSRGDYDLFKETLADQAGVEVGSDRGTCLHHVGGIACELFFDVVGRGTIQTEGFISNGQAEGSLAITGGTGEFAGAGGHLTVVFGDELLFTFEFTA